MKVNVKVGLGKKDITWHEKEYDDSMTYADVAKDFSGYFDELAKKTGEEVILAARRSKLMELNKKVKDGDEIRFITTGTDTGYKTYVRGVLLMMLKAFKKVAGDKGLKDICMKFQVNNSLYCEAIGITITDEILKKVQDVMLEYADADIPFEKEVVSTDDALKIFEDNGMEEKKKLFKFRRASKVNIYSFDGMKDYYYGYMPASSGVLKYFSLEMYEDGFMLNIPLWATPDKVEAHKASPKLFATLKESERWGKMVDVDTVGALNEAISKGDSRSLILVQEALQEKKIADIAVRIASDPKKKIVMIAGPSSSGKTSFSHRLSIQLRALGLHPHPIALDNYFKERTQTPLDEHGNYDFECLEAIDIELFNKQMTDLLRGEKVQLPTFDFVEGKKEYKGDYRQLKEGDILVIEGIHGLNDKLSYSLPAENKFKIYISALMQLNIDEHNRISTSDGRLIRRMVRDARTRGSSAKRTIGMWYSVRRGENKYIFPFQEEADVMFNSAMLYELAVLKPYAEALLFGIDREAPEYIEAKRLLKFLDYFIALSSEDIPKNSIIREFIGGSLFNV